MAFPVTLNGRTYTLTDFEGTNYVDGLPDAFEDFVTQAGQIYSTTSTTSNSISTGSKTFTVEASKPYQVGTPLRIADTAAVSTNWIDGIVTAYSGTTLTVNAVAYAGSGTKTAWSINIGGGPIAYTGTLPIAQGGTGATTAAAARTNIDVYSKSEADTRYLNISGDSANITFGANMSFGDSNKIIMGAESELQIFSDGTKSYLIESGSGDLELRATDFVVKNAGNTKIMASFNDGGAVQLRYDDEVALATTSTGIDVTGTGRFLKTDNNSNIVLETTDADADAGPVLDMYRNSASPLNNDQLGKIEFSGENSNGDKTIYGYLRAQIRSTTAGDESPKISLHALREGVDTNFFEYDGADDEIVVNESAQDIAFRVETPGLTHALCTTSAGIDGVRIGTATSVSDVRLAVHNGATGPNTELYRASTGTSGDVLQIRSDVGGSQTLIGGFEANGDVMSATQVVQAPSDIKLKQDIVDATSQWDDIKALQLRNYRMKSHVVEMGDDAPTHLGVIAQEVEAAGMTGLVDDKPDIDGDFDGPSTKIVKYTMIYLKAVKALQEAMDRIETLEAKVTALENP